MSVHPAATPETGGRDKVTDGVAGESLRRFFETFETLADAHGSINRLRGLVRDLAVTGRLLSQDACEGDADVLIGIIARERAALIAAGELAQRRYADVPHPPQELPSTWSWVRLGDIVRDHGQKIPDQRFTYIDVSSINNLHGTLADNLSVIRPGDAPSRARKIVQRGSVIYSTVRPYLLKIAIVDKLPKP